MCGPFEDCDSGPSTMSWTDGSCWRLQVPGWLPQWYRQEGLFENPAFLRRGIRHHVRGRFDPTEALTNLHATACW